MRLNSRVFVLRHCWPGGRRRTRLARGLARDGAPADIAPTERSFPVDQIDCAIGACLRLGDSLACCRDVEDAAAGGEDAPVAALGSGMEDLHAIELRRRIQPGDRKA